VCRCARLIGALGGVALVTACTIPPPSGPTVMAIPPPGKNLAVFQQEDVQCRSYAAATIGALPPGQATSPCCGERGLQCDTCGAGRDNWWRSGVRGHHRCWCDLCSFGLRTMCRRATTSLTPSALTHPAMPSCQCQPAFMAIMLLRARSIPGTAILGSSGPDWASPGAASSYSTGTTNSIMASTVFMRDLTEAPTPVACMVEVTGAANLGRPVMRGQRLGVAELTITALSSGRRRSGRLWLVINRRRHLSVSHRSRGDDRRHPKRGRLPFRRRTLVAVGRGDDASRYGHPNHHRRPAAAAVHINHRPQAPGGTVCGLPTSSRRGRYPARRPMPRRGRGRRLRAHRGRRTPGRMRMLRRKRKGIIQRAGQGGRAAALAARQCSRRMISPIFAFDTRNLRERSSKPPPARCR
jgi:hypothetical protein